MYSGKDADRILHLLTQTGAKLVVAAPGTKKPRSRKAHAVDVGNLLQINLLQTKGMPMLSDVKLIERFDRIKRDYIGLVLVQFCCELCSTIAQEDVNEPGLFNNLLNLLQSENLSRPALLAAALVLRVLAVSGHLPAIDHDLETGLELDLELPVWRMRDIGYTQQLPLNDQNAVPARLLKTQKFILSHSFNHINQITLELEEQLELLNQHLQWLDASDIPRPKSTTILLNALNK